MGVWVAIAVGLFVLGSIMSLKPSGVDVRLDKLRMSARRLELNPKVIACPQWIRGKDNELGRGMLGQYALIVDDLKLPESHYQVIDGELRPVQDESGDMVANYALDHEPLGLPESIAPLVKGVYCKANSVVVFWEDSGYVKPSTNPNYDAEHIEPDLLQLKSRMQAWAQKMSA